MGARKLFQTIFTWWNRATFSTLVYTRYKGVRVGEDAQGNVYYRTADDSRRWVIYNGQAEASRIPPGWHGWIHRRTDTPPSEEEYRPRLWEKPHRANPTGTPQAEFPPGSLYRRQPARVARPPFDRWRPGSDGSEGANG